jgi:AmpD protein
MGSLTALPIDGAGYVAAARQVPSPNQDARPRRTRVSLVVVHGISLPPGQYGGGHIEALFSNSLDISSDPYFAQLEGLRVSAHFLVSRHGDLTQFVSAQRRAWHAGVSSWRGRERCNDYSIGVELEGMDEQPYEHAQYVCLARLTLGLRARYPIEDFVSHAEVAPGRKTDPGPGFDWSTYWSLLGTTGT